MLGRGRGRGRDWGRGSAAFPGSARGHGSLCARTARAPGPGGSPAPATHAPRGAAAGRPGTPRGARWGQRGECEVTGRGLRVNAQGVGTVRACRARPGRTVSRSCQRRPWIPRAARPPRLRPCRRDSGFGRQQPAAPPPHFSPVLAVRARSARRARRTRLLSLPHGPASWGLSAAPTLPRHPRTPGAFRGMDRTACTRCWRQGTVARQNHPGARVPPAGRRGGGGFPSHPPTRPRGPLTRLPVPCQALRSSPNPELCRCRLTSLSGGAVGAESAGVRLGTWALCLQSFPEWTQHVCRRKLSPEILRAFPGRNACPGESGVVAQARSVCSWGSLLSRGARPQLAWSQSTS